jgi:putative molybdopterin biosynthesis protein
MPLRLINLCYRQQGLIVGKGNPKKIKNLSDIVQNKLTFINRQGGAGTRLLTDKIIKETKINPADIRGYDHEEYTHMSVAAAVAAGSVDAGMGILAAARALNLDFIPIAEERYDLIIPERFIDDEKVQAVLDLMESNKDFHKQILALGGYDLRDCGKLIYKQ